MAKFERGRSTGGLLSFIRHFNDLLTRKERRDLFLLQLLFVVSSFFELISVAGVAPFMAVVADQSLIEKNAKLAWLYQTLQFESARAFVVFLGVSVVAIIVVSSGIALLTLRASVRTIYDLAAKFASDLFRYYLSKDYLYHAYTNSARLSSNIQSEVRRFADTVLMPIFILISKLMTVTVIGAGLLFLDPLLTITVLAVLLTGYALVLKFIRKDLGQAGVLATEMFFHRGKAIQEGFGAIKEIKAFRREKDFFQNFEEWNRSYNATVARTNVLAAAPRAVMEIFAFGGMITAVLFLFNRSSNFVELVPMLSMFAIAGMKLMPALQQCFHSLAYINGNINSYEVLAGDLSLARSTGPIDVSPGPRHPLQLRQGISLVDICFKYPSSDRQVLDHVSLEIPANTTVAFVGPSGSGKTTCADMILGLIKPDSGMVLVDGEQGNGELLRGSVGYVSQSVHLIDDTIAANIAFSPSGSRSPDREKLVRAARLARLEELIESLPQGYESRVGEKGVQLSGGQRQRIGIARALYHGASILIFDEATSALDGINEKGIIESMAALNGVCTIIMIAHRIATVRDAHKIFLFDHGKVEAEGAFEELLGSSAKFRHLVETTSA